MKTVMMMAGPEVLVVTIYPDGRGGLAEARMIEWDNGVFALDEDLEPKDLNIKESAFKATEDRGLGLSFSITGQENIRAFFKDMVALALMHTEVPKRETKP